MIDLEAYQSAWADDARCEALRLREVLTDVVDAVEHIGSTAVPSLLAKPTIDLAARAITPTPAFVIQEAVASIGYSPHVAGPKNHAVYVRSGSTGQRTHILHLFTAEQWTHCNQRLFRDKLLHDADARRRYQELKLSLADAVDGHAYTSGKRLLIEELVNEERAARGLPPISTWDK